MVQEKHDASPVPEEEWELASGLPDDFDFWVTKSYFGFDPEYQSGKVPLLLWEGESPDYILDRHIAWSLGQDWTITGDGRYVEHPKRRAFVKTSIIGHLVERVTKELGVPMHEYGSPRDAHVWVGHGFHLVREEIEFKGAVERGILVDRGGKTLHPMPTVYLGYKEVTVALSPTVSPEIIGKLEGMAKTLGLKQFQLAATKLPEVSGDDNLMADVLDSSEGGFWSRRQV